MSPPAPGYLAASSLGTLAGLVAATHNGVPVWFKVLMVVLALGLGIWSSAARPADREARAEAWRLARANAGALGIMALTSTWIFDLGLSAALMLSLVIGLLGSRVIERLESSAAGQDLAALAADIIARIAKGGK